MAVFDQYAKNYDEGHAKAVRASGFDPEYFHQYKVKEVFNYLLKTGLAGQPLKILNFGCGTGNSEKYLRKYFPDSTLYSIDISEESINVAKDSNRDISNVFFETFDGIDIPFDIEFDVIFIAMVFHHIPRNVQLNALMKIKNKLKKQGHIFLFELNPLNPMTMWVAINNDYKFDKDSRLLSPFYTNHILKRSGLKPIKLKYTIFFPKFFSILIPLEKYLCKVPIGAHYYYIIKTNS